MNERQIEFMKNYLKENLTLDIDQDRDYYQEGYTYTVKLKLEGEEISRIWFDN